MPQITKKDVVQIAFLARLSLSEKEQENMVEHFLQILTYAEKLNDLTTDEIEPATHALSSMPILREDIIMNSPRPEELLKSAPTCEANFFKVPKVID
ncbi:MAG: Asp-tRNA(Asn)/Glu-tRNA(Gln) amidotransferase subunit GatC [Candidatus Binatia bacterium]